MDEGVRSGENEDILALVPSIHSSLDARKRFPTRDDRLSFRVAASCVWLPLATAQTVVKSWS